MTVEYFLNSSESISNLEETCLSRGNDDPTVSKYCLLFFNTKDSNSFSLFSLAIKNHWCGLYKYTGVFGCSVATNKWNACPQNASVNTASLNE